MIILSEKLMKMQYYDKKAETRLEAYADTVVIERDGDTSYIAAIRFGGYPESVKGMSEALYGGGSVIIEIDAMPVTLYTRVKQYRKELSHDGIYAEATLLVKDEEQYDDCGNTNTDAGTDANTKAYDKPRKCYLFCEQGDSNRLFEELDKKTAVPLIPEFKEYVLSQLQSRGILKQLQVISCKERFDVWLLAMSEGEKNIAAVVNDGLKSGAIAIPGYGNTAIPGSDSGNFPAIRSVTQYLNTFGVQIAERIKGQFEPLFDPATEALSPEILAVNDNIIKTAGYSLYDAQLAIAEAHKRCLQKKKATLCIAECGSGKTKIGITALHAYQQRHSTDTHTKHFNVVICPSHMTKKWVREIEESLPNTFAVIITSITELNEVYAAYEQDNKTCYVIMSKEKARDGCMKRPTAKWNKRRKAFICPSCDKKIEMELIDCCSKYTVAADQFFFKRENKQNHKCPNCGSLLWTALVPEQQSEWVKVSNLGFVHRKLACQYLEGLKKKPAIYDAVQDIADNPSGYFPNAGAYRRFPISTYIKRHMKGKVDGLIIDELHNYNNNSGQGDAMGELFQAAKKVIGMTATLINGYSSGIFHLLFRISPDLMQKDGRHYDKAVEFNSEYGVTESVYEIAALDYNSNRRTVKKKIRERQLPGVSPLVYSRFLMDSAAFLSLNDMGKDLPEYEEIPVELQMNKDVAYEYSRIESRFKDILRTQRDIAKKILSAYLGLLTVYPDQPYGQKPVVHPITGDKLVVPRDMSSFNELHEKDNSVLDVVQRKTAEGGRVLVYTSWIRTDTQDKLYKLLTENGYRVSVLTSSIPPNRREEWVENQVSNGIQVLITNPSLVETGLDLNDFTTLYYYNIAYNLFTLRQSSRRSWRINQKAPRIEVYFTYYEGTMQNRAIRLMASKLAVAGIIEGNFTDEGLAAMSDCADMTTALARELTAGIKNEVEDLSAVFRKMAVLKPVAEVVADDTDIIAVIDDAAIMDDIPAIPAYPVHINIIDDTSEIAAYVTEKSTPMSGLLSFVNFAKPIRAARMKAVFADGEQTSLLDFLEVAA
jgi:superfamily II DNA or RNA helicase